MSKEQCFQEVLGEGEWAMGGRRNLKYLRVFLNGNCSGFF